MRRRPYYSGSGEPGLGDIASIGGGFLGGMETGLSRGDQFTRLLMAEEAAKSGRQDRDLQRRLSAFKLTAEHPDLADQVPALFGDAATVVTPEAQAQAAQFRKADEVLGAFSSSGDLKAFTSATNADPKLAAAVASRLRSGKHGEVAKALRAAVDEQKNAGEIQAAEAEAQQLQATGVSREEARRRVYASSPRRMQLFEKARHLQGPESTPYQQWQMDPTAQAAKTTATEQAKVAALDAPYDNLADIAHPDFTSLGVPDQTMAPGSGVYAPPRDARLRARTFGERALEQEGAVAAARVTPEARQRLELDEQRVGQTRRGLDLREREIGARVNKPAKPVRPKVSTKTGPDGKRYIVELLPNEETGVLEERPVLDADGQPMLAGTQPMERKKTALEMAREESAKAGGVPNTPGRPPVARADGVPKAANRAPKEQTAEKAMAEAQRLMKAGLSKPDAIKAMQAAGWDVR